MKESSSSPARKRSGTTISPTAGSRPARRRVAASSRAAPRARGRRPATPRGEALEEVRRATRARSRMRGAIPSGSRRAAARWPAARAAPRRRPRSARRRPRWPRPGPSGGRRRPPDTARAREHPLARSRTGPIRARRTRSARRPARSPAASSIRLRSRNGTSSSRRGADHLRARPRAAGLDDAQRRVEIPASSARSSWASRRRCRHSRSRPPTDGRSRNGAHAPILRACRVTCDAIHLRPPLPQHRRRNRLSRR